MYLPISGTVTSPANCWSPITWSLWEARGLLGSKLAHNSGAITESKLQCENSPSKQLSVIEFSPFQMNPECVSWIVEYLMLLALFLFLFFRLCCLLRFLLKKLSCCQGPELFIPIGSAIIIKPFCQSNLTSQCITDMHLSRITLEQIKFMPFQVVVFSDVCF